ncbi:beta-lactamase/transpeptidase-like protein [Aspergillus saccharolyticus JOP 1030-1]|uniref:Beta-lactamase/transpeptidase-like protein n=1 Tax=Aspergillus saccharolyticus JOP 1030-1 TaxID=1450539 RepID=A0A318ZFR9_9EURO|nr:beta-lactamase/transpeptidase-like protein [Aspergillus saccharolyticus JOP 1030-1]PYH45915.1 beta-lactamase/transpeptidase-like protein [Aspergillus saccharolyticus JOP 1030-1]
MVVRSNRSPLTPEFDALVEEQLAKWKVPGLTVSVVHGSSTSAKAYGVAEFPDKKMTVDSLFDTCSTTKAFTAALMSMAIDDSKETSNPISWDTPVSSLIREDFVLADPYATANTTIEDMLSHRSGLPGHQASMSLAMPNETLREEVQKLRHLPLAFAPRTTFNYCNHMFMVASHVLETLSGQSLGQLMRERIWKPVGMKDTYFSKKEVLACPATSQRLVKGYTWDPTTNRHVQRPYMDYAPTTGTGAIVSNVLDYAKWIRTLIYQGAPISRVGYRELLFPRTVIGGWEDINVPPGQFHLYALGWFVDNYHGEQLYWHSGSWEGFGIMVGFVPSKKFGFAMMGNTQKARYAELELYLYLLDQLLGKSDEDRAAYIAKIDAIVQERQKTMLQGMEEVKRRLYPGRTLRLPHPLSLDHYTGTYFHPGHGPITLFLEDGKLHADLMDRVAKSWLRLEHASGIFFVAKAYKPEAEGVDPDYFAAEFYVGATGAVERLGLDLEPALNGQMIWFERVLS